MASDKKILYVHIGTHKTGTTSVQHFLYNADRALRERGVYVPSTGRFDDGAGHHRIAWELVADSRRPQAGNVVASLANELRLVTCDRAVISSEDFEYLTDRPDRIKSFEEEMKGAGWHTRYLVWFRPQGDYAVSLYRELCKHGYKTPLALYLWRTIVLGVVRPNRTWCYYFDYDRIIDAFSSGKARESVVAQAYKGDVVPELMEGIGVVQDEYMRGLIRGSKRLNERPPRRLPWFAKPGPALINARYWRKEPKRIASCGSGTERDRAYRCMRAATEIGENGR